MNRRPIELFVFGSITSVITVVIMFGMQKATARPPTYEPQPGSAPYMLFKPTLEHEPIQAAPQEKQGPPTLSERNAALAVPHFDPSAEFMQVKMFRDMKMEALQEQVNIWLKTAAKNGILPVQFSQSTAPNFEHYITVLYYPPPEPASNK